MRKLAVLLLSSVVVAGAADAAVSVNVTSTDYGLDAGTVRSGDTLITFDETGALPNNFKLTLPANGAVIQKVSNSNGAAPATSATTVDGTNYLAVYNGTATLLGTQAYTSVSFLWGSIDTYNTLQLLDATGTSIYDVTMSMIPSSGNGNQTLADTNRRVTITSNTGFYGIGAKSTSAAFELDNVKFTGAVPEPASWAMMVGGFGLVGGAMRTARRRTVAFA